ncbi:hypothetical protein HDU98_006510 [Podochytrium sp. JEL0797]|nr:hypothetical protein HDU98_006510 [Podochytrium sp. JEL0797]
METLELLSIIIGWAYFVAWSVSFYPQIILNFRRRSVEGLSVDFVLLNIIGFICYSVFNLVQFFYYKSESVKLNDVFFAVHALVLCLFTFGQILYYTPSIRTVFTSITKPTRLVLAVIFVAIIVGCSIMHGQSLLEYIGSVKVGISLYKYIPQLILNWRNRSTVGWSITNILLDATGGILSFAQVAIDAQRLGHGFFDNPNKLALGLISLTFDVLFMLQHYVWYRQSREVVDEKVAVAPVVVEGSAASNV